MATRIRFLTNLVGNDADYRANDVATFADDEAAELIAAGFAIADLPDLSTAFAAALDSAGYSALNVEPSGSQVAPSGAYYKSDANHFTILTPSPQHLADVILVQVQPRW